MKYNRTLLVDGYNVTMFHIMKEPLRKQSVSTYATFDSEDPKMVTLQSDQNNLVIKQVTLIC